MANKFGQVDEVLQLLIEHGGIAADYIVDRETSGIWTYEKMYSGALKMTGKVTNANIAPSSWIASGNIFYANITSREFPFDLAELHYFNWYVEDPSSGRMLFTLSTASPDNGLSTSETGRLAVGRSTKPTENVSTNLYFKVEGKWK